MASTNKVVYRVPSSKISFTDNTRIITVSSIVINPADVLHIWVYSGSTLTNSYDAWLGVANFALCTLSNDNVNTTITLSPTLPVLSTGNIILIEYYADANLPVQYNINSYSNVQGDFVATPTTGTTSIVISQLNAFTLSSVNMVGADIRKISSSGLTTSLNTNLYTITASATTINLPLNDVFVSGDTVLVKLTGPDKYNDNISNTSLNTILNTPQIISPMPLIDTTNVAAGTNYYPSSDGIIVNQINSIATLWVTAGAANSNLIYLEVSDEDETITSPANFKRYMIPTIIAEDLTVCTPSMPVSGMKDLQEIFVRPNEAIKVDIDLSQLLSYRIRFVIVTANGGTATNKHYISFGGQMLGTGIVGYGKKISNDTRYIQSTTVSTATAANIATANNTWNYIQQLDVRGVDQLELFITYTKNNSTGGTMQIVPNALRNSRTANDAALFYTDNLADYQISLDESASTTTRVYKYQCAGYPYISVQSMVSSSGSTVGTVIIQANRYGY